MNDTSPSSQAQRTCVRWALWICLLWELVLLFSHTIYPIGLGCAGGVGWLSCGASLIHVYNQIIGIPWVYLGAGAILIGLGLSYQQRGWPILAVWIFAALLPFGYLRGLELARIHGLCPVCWLLFISWLAAAAAVPAPLRGKARLWLMVGLLVCGAITGSIAAAWYPDPTTVEIAVLLRKGWDINDLRRPASAADFLPPFRGGLHLILEEGCPYCDALTHRTLSAWRGTPGTAWILPHRVSSPGLRLPGGNPKVFPTLRVIEHDKIIKEWSGFISAARLDLWLGRSSPPQKVARNRLNP